MASVVKNEIQALSSMIRSLCIAKQTANVRVVRHFNVPAAYLQRERRLIPHVNAAVTSSSQKSTQNVCCFAPLFQQQRSYAKKPPSPKKPLSFDYSGDLVTQKPLNPKATQVDFKTFTQLENAPESVQKICSIGFASGVEKKIHRKEEMKDRILHMFGDSADREMHVAMLTVDIRNMIPHILTSRKDKLNKARLVEKIQLRKKILKYLRRTDYQRFMWLLQELQIRYVLPPEYYRRVTRKYKRKQQVWDAAFNLRQKKIAELKAQLEAEKAEFLKHKEETLKQIQEDAERYQLDMDALEKSLQRKRIGKTYPRIYTWEERQQMEKEAAMK